MYISSRQSTARRIVTISVRQSGNYATRDVEACVETRCNVSFCFFSMARNAMTVLIGYASQHLVTRVAEIKDNTIFLITADPPMNYNANNPIPSLIPSAVSFSSLSLPERETAVSNSGILLALGQFCFFASLSCEFQTVCPWRRRCKDLVHLFQRDLLMDCGYQWTIIRRRLLD